MGVTMAAAMVRVTGTWCCRSFPCLCSKGAHLVQCARNVRAVQLFGCLAILETHNL